MTNRLKCGHSRDSFDRFGNDLCEELLKPMIFRDKIRFECVSKQWKRCVFAKQFDLYFELTNRYESDENFLSILFDYYGNSQSIIIETIDTILKKCSFVRNIVISDEIKLNKLLSTIANNCEHLTSIRLNYDEFSAHELTYFGELCGKKLAKISLSDKCECDSKYQSLLKLCPNAMRVENVDMSYLIDNGVVVLPKLSDLKGVYGYDRISLTNIFNTSYKYGIKSFHAVFDDRVDVQNRIFDQIACFANLLNLEMRFELSDELTPDFGDKMMKIGENCSLIKLLRLVSIEHKQILRFVNSFARLTRFELYMSGFDSSIDIETALSVMNSCVELKHLVIIASIGDTFFADVHQYLPRISFLKIRTTKSLTDKLLDNLSKLSQLKTLSISRLCSDISAARAEKYNISEDVSCFTRHAICNIIANCRQLKSFGLYTRNSLNIDTYDGLIESAINRPRIIFKHQFFKGVSDGDINEWMNRYGDVIPGKLKIRLIRHENVLND